MAEDNIPTGGALKIVAWGVPLLLASAAAAAAAATAAASRGPWQQFVRGSFVASWFLGFVCICTSAAIGFLVLRVMQRIESHMQSWAEESAKTRESIDHLATGIDRALERKD
jgi:hypothetical protein